MGASNAGTSNDSGGKDTKTPFGTASSTKTKDKFGYDKPKNTFSKIASDGGFLLSAIKNNPFSKMSEKKNRDFYDTRVKPYKGNTKSTYEDYIRSRGKGEVDAMGRTISKNNGSDNNNTIKEVTKTAPTVAEVDQATTNTDATETAETTEANKKLKIKKKGRYQSIMTSAKGVTKASSDYSLGKTSILGMV